MAFNAAMSFDAKRITNGQYIPNPGGVPGTAIALPCTGKVSAEAVIAELIKKCEGSTSDKVTSIKELKVKITGHFPVSILRSVFGLTNTGLKAGVYALGEKASGIPGIWTWEIDDMHDTEKKLIAFPNMALTSGFAFEIENGKEEIAEAELEFTAMIDANKNFYYEGIASEITDEAVKTGWSKTFASTLVKAPGA